MGTAIAIIGGFVAAITGVAGWLRRQEADGAFDIGSSAASRPGLRRLFDFGPNGWTRDGRNQSGRR